MITINTQRRCLDILLSHHCGGVEWSLSSQSRSRHSCGAPTGLIGHAVSRFLRSRAKSDHRGLGFIPSFMTLTLFFITLLASLRTLVSTVTHDPKWSGVHELEIESEGGLQAGSKDEDGVYESKINSKLLPLPLKRFFFNQKLKYSHIFPSPRFTSYSHSPC